MSNTEQQKLQQVAERLAALPEDRQLIFLRQLGEKGVRLERLPIVRQPCEQAPLSAAQSRLWFLWQMEPHSAAYNIPAAVRLRGELDEDALQRSFAALIARHESLRTLFREIEGEHGSQAVQVILPSLDPELQRFDLSALPVEQREPRAREQLEQAAQQPFDLSTGPLLRLALIRLDAREHILLLTLHHIVSDGWSMGVLTDEFATLYTAHVSGAAAQLEALPVQYADYARWQRLWMAAGEGDRQLDYWTRQLGGEALVLTLPSDRPRPAVQSYRGAALDFQLPAALSNGLRELARSQGATLFMLLLAAYQVLLFRYSGQRELRVGVPVANRGRGESERLIGFFVNTQVLGTEMNENETFVAFLDRTRQAVLGAQAHQDLPFERLVEALQPERSLSYNPLFQVAYNHLPSQRDGLRELPSADGRGLTLESLELDVGIAKFDLMLSTEESRDGLVRGQFGYATDLFDTASIAQMREHFLHLLQALLTDPRQVVGRLPMLSGNDREQLLHGWNDTAADFPDQVQLQSLIEQQVAATPDALAVQFGNQQLSYRELNARANQLARWLREQGVGPDVLVGVCVERSLELVLALLAIVKAGGAYVPMDPDYPRERLEHMLGDSGVQLLLTQQHLLEQLPASAAQSFCLDSQWPELQALDASDLPTLGSPQNLAYLIYTSGSTGKPKGAGNSHAALINRLHWMQKAYQLDHTDRILQKTPFSFDVSVWEFFWPLLTGAALVVAEPGAHRDPLELRRVINEGQVSVLHFVPSMLQAFVISGELENCPSLKQVMCSGEALPYELQQQFRQRHSAQLHNLYGPTEAAIDVSYWACDEENDRHQVPIGRPIDNLRLYILDAFLEPVPQGVAGELYIGGVGLARGYHLRPGLTAERFVADPFTAGERLYRTGDLARWRADGAIEYVGRIDHQVKIRGLRIELGEIEARLQGLESVEEAVVIARDTPQGKQLVGYVVVHGTEGSDSESLRRELLEHLPEYMVPAQILVLPAMPLSPNGKLDRKALPEPDFSQQQKQYQAPRDERETLLAGIWQSVLGIERVGIDDNFFELGGDSIVSIQVVSRARQAGLQLSPKDLFLHQTLKALAAVARQGDSVAVVNAPASGRTPFLPIQHWFFEQQLPHRAHWNQSVLLGCQQTLDSAVLERALGHVCQLHDGLRLRFGTEPSSAEYAVYEHDPELLWIRQAADADELLMHCEAAQRSLDLSQGPLLRALLVELADGSQRLLLVIHHLVVDGVSWRVLLEDLQTAYRQLASGVSVQLPPRSSSFQQWAERLAAHAHSAEMSAELKYWQTSLQGPSGDLPARDPQASLSGRHARTHRVELDAATTAALLQQAPAVFRTQVNDLLLTALTRSLCAWTGETSALVQLEGHGREALFDDLDLSRTVGWFTSLFALRLHDGGEPIATLKSVKEQLRGVPQRGVGYGLLRYLGGEGQSLAALPQARVTFNYLGQFDHSFGSDALFQPASEKSGANRDAEGALSNWLSVDGQVFGGKLSLRWTYSTAMFDDTAIEALAQSYLEQLQGLIALCLEEGAGGVTPSDFPLAGVEQAQLDALPLAARQIEDLYPLAPMQQGMLFHALYENEGGVYVNQLRVDIDGVDAERFRTAWQAALDSHDNLRASFLWEGLAQPLQLIHRQLKLPLEVLDWRHRDDQAIALEALAQAQRAAGFALDQPPLLRLVLVRCDEQRYQLIYTHHHILMDGWSNAQLFAEVLQRYAGQAVVASGHYRDYIQWLQGRDASASEAFWQTQLAVLDAPTRLAECVPQSTAQDGFGQVQRLLTVEQGARLSAFARQHKVTVNTVLQAAWALLLQRYSGQSTVVFGATVAGRPAELAGIEQQLGLFINSLPVVVSPRAEQPLADYLQALQVQNLQLREHEHTPLSNIQRAFAQGGEALFDSLLVFENYPVAEALRQAPGGLSFSGMQAQENTNYPLTLMVAQGERLRLNFDYRCSHFHADTVQSIGDQLLHLLWQFCADGRQPLGEIGLLDSSARQRVLRDFNASAMDYPRQACLHHLIEQQAALNPQALALDDGSARLSHAQLNARANRLARWLRAQGAGPDCAVGVALERTVQLPVALLAVLKAGAAYVPLDPEFPAERLAHMLADSEVRLLLTQEHLLSELPDSQAQVFCLDRDWSQLDSLAEHDLRPDELQRPVNIDDLAYVIYTSGSTGKPKGVAVRHGGVVNFMSSMAREPGLTGRDRVLALTSLSFDIFALELYLPLLVGGSVQLVDRDCARDPTRLLATVLEKGVTVIQATPSTWTLLSAHEDFSRLQGCRFFCGGEALSVELAAVLSAQADELWNLYGPTETTIWSAAWRIPRGGRALLGKPIANTQLYVLDAALHPLPAGVAGELYIAGDGLARGYHARPGLTAERFVADPFNAQGGCMYRTGDLARWSQDGVLEYFGRIDHQVKVRGFRIELGEIESCLLACDGVREAVVIARETPLGKQLLGYVVADGEAAIGPEELRAALQAQLPDYMVPAQVMVLTRMPLTPNGKLDRKALPDPDFSSLQQRYQAPRSELELRLAELWQQVLGLKQVGIDDNFFELGGDSIVSIQLAGRARQAGLQLSPRQLFEHPTVAQLAQVITAVGAPAANSVSDSTPAHTGHFPLARLDAGQIEKLGLDLNQVENLYPLSPMQQGMLFHALDNPGSGLYVNQISVPVEGLDSTRFAQAWRRAVARHDTLRSGFIWQSGLREPLQVVYATAPAQLRLRDDVQDIVAFAEADRLEGFDLAQPPLQRLTLIDLGEGRQHLIWTTHHLLMDGWSGAQLIKEVLQLYAGAELPAVSARYADYIGWLQRQDGMAAEAFWRARLAQVQQPTLLADSLSRPAEGDGHGLSYSHYDATATERLKTYARSQRITLNTLLQSAWLLLLQRYTGQQQVVFGATVAGRPAQLPGIDSLLGLFINTLPIAQSPQAQDDLGEWLRQLQAYNAEVREFEHTPLYDIQRWAGHSGQALFDSIIVFENYPVDEALRRGAGNGPRFGELSLKDVTNVPMDLAIRVGEGLEIEYQYLRSHFDAVAVERIRGNMEQILDAMVAGQARFIGDLQCLSEADRSALSNCRGPHQARLPAPPVHLAIADQARLRPSSTALLCGTEQLDYAALEFGSNRLAHHLISLGIGPEVRVGVVLPRGVAIPLALLAVLKSGGAYVPLDADYPRERLAFQMADAGIALLITDSRLRERLPLPDGVLCLELDALDLSTERSDVPSVKLEPENLAYIIYTSGSTGQPKGVSVAHGPLAMHCAAIGELYEMDSSTRELHFMSFAFDGAHERWLTTLVHGGSLVLRGEELWTPEQVYTVLHEQRIDVAAFPPAYLQQLAEHALRDGNPPPVRIYCFGGDAVPNASFELAKKALRPQCITNGYGPTETVVTPLLWKADANTACDAAYAPIGKSVGARQLHILDPDLRPVPLGVAGELYIGGEGLARGYHQRPDLTAERFVADPFSTDGGRLYRTGDLVRGRVDGVIDYVGRIDHQVKIRGFRIELGEIEARLQEHPQVREALVVARDGHSGKQLIGYVVNHPGVALSGDDLRSYLRARLPDYMVPVQVMLLERMPLSPAGKLDRKALPEPQWNSGSSYVAPRNDTEQVLAAIWQEVLQVEQVGIHDNFFDLGGDSILSLQVISRVRQAEGLGLDIRLRDLLQYQTIAGLLERAQGSTEADAAEPQAVAESVGDEAFGLIPIQQWLFEQDLQAPEHFNQAILLQCREPLDVVHLAAALQAVLSEHASLRLAFVRGNDGQWRQRYCELSELQDGLRADPVLWLRDALDSEAALAIANQAQRSLDITNGRLLRAVYSELADGSQRLLLVAHHLGIDGVSWRILLEDLQQAYTQLCNGQEPRFSARTSSYRAWAQSLREYAAHPRLLAELPYWLQQTEPAGLGEPPQDNPRGSQRVAHMQQVQLRLDRDLTGQLLKVAPEAYRTQINDLLLTALGRVLCRFSDSESVLLGLEGHGREDIFEGLDHSRTLGWFTSLFPLRLTPGQGGYAESVVATREQLRAVPDKGIGHGVLRYLGDAQTRRLLAGRVQPRVTFNYLGQFDQSFDDKALFAPLQERPGDAYAASAPLNNWLEIIGQVYDGELALRCLFSSRVFRTTTVEQLMAMYRQELQGLIQHCCAQVAEREQMPV